MPSEFSGLTQREAQQRLQRDGANELASARRRAWWDRWADVLSEPMIALLVAAAVIYTALGDLGEGLTLALFVLAVVGLTLYQEGKSEVSIDALRELTQPMARVTRDGQRGSIASREVVCGDVLHLSEGDRVAADGVLLWVDNLQVDESLLTGESVPVSKSSVTTTQAAITAESADTPRAQQVFGGTHVVRGQAVVHVTATGPRSEMGRIGASLAALDTEPTPLHRQTTRLVRIIATVALVLCTTLVITQGVRTGDWLAALLAGIALAMGILPEEYPVVLALFPALGAHRLTRQGVLTRRLNAIETLGATTVLCTDKTGTLTENRMQVARLAIGDAAHPEELDVETSGLRELPEAFHRLVEQAILASAPDPFDPMEQAFHRLGQTLLQHTPHLHDDWTLVQTYALSPQLRALSHVWQQADGSTFAIATKGAPEAVMSLCHLDAATQAHWLQAVEQMAAQGLRVLAVAQGRSTTVMPEQGRWPDSAHDFDFSWVGLVGLRDPLRPEVIPAMAQAQAAGIRVLMITGDFSVTAQAIAEQAGMPAGDTLSGEQLDLLSDAELQQTLRHTRVCARISPHQKLRIVQCLKADGEIVTMTGDGVNDAPALKAAHVGVAMGQRGTDVAREAADLVLVDDNFASIVRGIRTGRRIFDNLQKSMTYIFAVHIPIAGVALLPMLLALPPLLLPLHIALLELVIDPACSLAFEQEPEDPLVMQRPARDTQAPLLGRGELMEATAQGLMVLGGLWLSYSWALGFSAWGMSWTPAWAAVAQSSTELQRSMVLVSLVTANGVLIAANRGSTRTAGRWLGWGARNPMAGWVTLSALLAVLLALYWPWLAGVLNLVALPPQALVVALGCGAIGWPCMVALRAWRSRTSIKT
jgi:Ca2+-transporting ATPase